MKKPDVCTLSPDTLGRFNWTEACRRHDEKYRQGTGTRWRADRILLAEMMQEIRRLDASWWERYLATFTAWIYWLTVRIFGYLWWTNAS